MQLLKIRIPGHFIFERNKNLIFKDHFQVVLLNVRTTGGSLGPSGSSSAERPQLMLHGDTPPASAPGQGDRGRFHSGRSCDSDYPRASANLLRIRIGSRGAGGRPQPSGATLGGLRARPHRQPTASAHADHQDRRVYEFVRKTGLFAERISAPPRRGHSAA